MHLQCWPWIGETFGEKRTTILAETWPHLDSNLSAIFAKMTFEVEPKALCSFRTGKFDPNQNGNIIYLIFQMLHFSQNLIVIGRTAPLRLQWFAG